MAAKLKDVGNNNSDLYSDISELKVEVDEFIKDTQKIHNDFRETVNNINSEFRAVDSIFSKHKRSKKLYFELQSHLKELKKLEREEGADSDVSCGKELDSISKQLSDIKLIVDELGKSKRKTGSYFVSLIMGKVSVRIWNKGDRYKFKSEYNRFKARWMSLFFIFPILEIVFNFNTFINQLQCLTFFFYYSSLAIRENILSLNGSRIESWWIVHHYVSMMISILLLILYDEDLIPTYKYVNYFNFYQGLVMLLQNDYQNKRHYARKALNKKTQLDIRNTEVIDEAPRNRYRILIPMLYVTYFIQLIFSIYFLFLLSSLQSIKNDTLKSIQMLTMSICWFALSIGNCSTLSKVLKRKKMKII